MKQRYASTGRHVYGMIQGCMMPEGRMAEAYACDMTQLRDGHGVFP